ncbi:MAG: hypothetical protein AAGB00_03755 [Planctomycetota bacterium]
MQPFPAAPAIAGPAGSLIYQTEASATIDSAGETEAFTLALDAGQTLSAVVEPAAGLDVSITVRDPLSVVLATSDAGSAAAAELVQLAPVAEAGLYTVEVTGVGATTGAFGVTAVLNAAFEEETVADAPGNNTSATAQNLDGAFSVVAGSTIAHTAVVAETDNLLSGGSAADFDWYEFSLTDGQVATAVVDADAAGTLTVELIAADGVSLLAVGAATGNARALVPGIADLTLDALPETFFLRVSGDAGAYSLTVVKDAAFDAESVPQVLPASGDALPASGDALGAINADFPVDNSTGVSGAVNLPANLIDGNGFLWDLAVTGSVAGGSDDAFDGAAVHGGFPVAGGGATLEETNREVVIGPRTIAGLDVSRKVYVPDDAGFARFLEVVTNNTAATHTYTVAIATNLGSDGATNLFDDDSGDASFGVDDDWLVTRDGSGEDPSVLHVVAGLGDRPTAASLSGDDVEYEFELTLAPGETQIVMHFLAQDTSAASLVTLAGTLSELGGGATEGMTAAESSQVVNFLADIDTYSLAVESGDTVIASTGTPAGGADGFVNLLDPRIELLDPNGDLVAADDNSAADGVNAIAAHQAGMTGIYTVRVLGAGIVGGEYTLDVEIDNSILLGDYNGDDTVNAADYTVWRDNLGTMATLANDPTPGVTIDDYLAWLGNFGADAAAPATAPGAAVTPPARSAPSPSSASPSALGSLGAATAYDASPLAGIAITSDFAPAAPAAAPPLIGFFVHSTSVARNASATPLLENGFDARLGDEANDLANAGEPTTAALDEQGRADQGDEGDANPATALDAAFAELLI